MDLPTPRSLVASASRAATDPSLGARLTRLLRAIGIGARAADHAGLLDHAQALLSLRGRASGPALASAFFDRYEASDPAERRAFLAELHDHVPRDRTAIEAAMARFLANPEDDGAAAALHEASESPLARLIRTLNLAPGGTRRLIALRTDLLAVADRTPGLAHLDRELEDAFEAWFNAGFLELRRIDWNSPASLLERLIRYEAVHQIAGWDDLRRRLEPLDRRCYGFFHPQMADDPLIFVEVALTVDLPSAIGTIIAEDRAAIDPREARSAIFYSISNCQEGLRGIPFGNFLIKQVVGLLRAELPHLERFATLSPVPGFARWLAREGAGAPVPQGEDLRRTAARYITTARDKRGQVLDPVARFHLGNGARLEAVHADADLSAKGMAQSHGVMVNYLYDLARIEANHIALAEAGEVAVSPGIETLLRPPKTKGKAKAKAKAA